MKIAVVIPSYRVRARILGVLAGMPADVDRIYVVDDACPQGSGARVTEECADPRVQVVTHEVNQGVGGATLTGYRAALADGAEIIVKLDGDGQMDPRLIPELVWPIRNAAADYTKGNRFFTVDALRAMPAIRVFGNSIVSFVSKASSGYWKLMDPANGFTAIHADVLRLLPLDKIDRRFFFESDMLFRLNIARAVVQEVPMEAVYADEQSNLRIGQVVLRFPPKYLQRFLKRIFLNYFLRDFNVGSLQLVIGSLLLAFGTVFGGIRWYQSIQLGVPATTGTVMVAALPVILGFQLLLAAVSLDVMSVPRTPVHPHARTRAGVGTAAAGEER